MSGSAVKQVHVSTRVKSQGGFVCGSGYSQTYCKPVRPPVSTRPLAATARLKGPSLSLSTVLLLPRPLSRLFFGSVCFSESFSGT